MLAVSIWCCRLRGDLGMWGCDLERRKIHKAAVSVCCLSGSSPLVPPLGRVALLNEDAAAEPRSRMSWRGIDVMLTSSPDRSLVV